MYKALQILVERKFEVFMNLILFRNVISKFWVEEMNNEVAVRLVRAGMVLANVRVWKNFILARDSGLVPVGAGVYKPESGKPIPEFYKNIKSSEEVTKKDLKETVLTSSPLTRSYRVKF